MKRSLVDSRDTADLALSDLTGMSRAELLDAWARVVRKSAVRGASRELLVHTIAWHLQAQRHGGLTKSVQRRLDRLGEAIDRGEPIGLVSKLDRMHVGIVLEREWRGETHVVTVTTDGFVYQGKRHCSLSQIARLITGTRWNGPAFFGLRSGKGKNKGKVPAGSDDVK
jgi:hypothetical protein